MKRIILLAAMLYVALGAMAQDTLHSLYPKDGYFYQYWMDSEDIEVGVLVYNTTGNNSLMGYEVNPKGDMLTVYGLACCFDTNALGYDTNFYYFTDTTLENVYEFAGLYERSADSLRLIAPPLMFRPGRDPLSHIFSYDGNIRMRNDFPMYEKYFDEPVTISNVAFLCHTMRTPHWQQDIYDSTGNRHVRGPKYRATYTYLVDWDSPWDESFEQLRVMYDPNDNTWSFLPNYTRYRWLMFPIIAPPDTTANPTDTLVVQPGYTLSFHGGDTIVLGGDTIVLDSAVTLAVGDTLVLPSGDTLVFHPGDTLVVNSGDTIFFGPNSTIFFSPGSTIAILGGTGGGDNPGGDDPVVGLRQTDMVYRYTAVSPNPATGSATVTSSFGLTQIEAFDEQGRLVQTLPATGLKADLDVSSWPRGTYLLRIHTPLGTATKKLLVQ